MVTNYLDAHPSSVTVVMVVFSGATCWRRTENRTENRTEIGTGTGTGTGVGTGVGGQRPGRPRPAA